jgi:hypothetical protein
MGQERRKYPRIGTDQVISFAPCDSQEHLGVGEQTLVAVGKVAWAIELDPITMDVGLEFLEIDSDALRLLEEYSDRG